MRYVIIVNGVVANIVVCDDANLAEKQGWILLDDGFWIGDLWDVVCGFSHPDVA
jgi:hypothetical protein